MSHQTCFSTPSESAIISYYTEKRLTLLSTKQATHMHHFVNQYDVLEMKAHTCALIPKTRKSHI